MIGELCYYAAYLMAAQPEVQEWMILTYGRMYGDTGNPGSHCFLIQDSQGVL